ncbi:MULTISPECIES: DUF2712 domain-containing protein [Bacteria]|uniref:DUF2712 domain-containing protein n=1 Tax=Bacteria TaxID=2 RepID=UPI001F0E0807|nr:DUF2712 domain-containing protein [Lactococcus lactis]MCH5428654.1 hypothetical protein [Lactococcus lactis]MCT0036122.1 hypothetical protein [Lactococcus lactis subsp. lactis]MCT0062261.1 hypothetical protein [Lactococcus lactis subsp. lactis]MCT0086171.1 hypothetical protein [Lactococcus lactis subsp. lactis]MCT0136748.1 hypothetical protein [Lactococcus lactis subsp. lactis]
MKKSMITATLGLAICASAFPVLANNHADSQWAGMLPNHQGNIYTPNRDKTDASSAWCALNNSGKGGINAWLQLSNGTEVGSPKTYMKVGQGKYIYNYVNENYHRTMSVRMAIESSYNNPVRIQVNGVWSPDSV